MTIDPSGFEFLKNSILLPNLDRPVKTVLVTGSVAGEGSSTTAMNLAVHLAMNSSFKVLLVDCNLRKPSLHDMLGLRNDKGFSDMVRGASGIDSIAKDDGRNLYVLTSGRGVNPAEVLGSDNLRPVIEGLRGSFDCVVLDSPPVNEYQDAKILASMVDGVVLVVRYGKTRWEVARNAKEQLAMNKANILGAVLNRRKYSIPEFIYRWWL